MTDTLPASAEVSTTFKKGTTRRSFLKWSAVTAGAAGLVATSRNLGMPSTASAAPVEGMEGVDGTYMNGCLANCQSRCPIRLQVKDGVAVRVIGDSTGSDELGDFQIRACVRGRNQRERIYSPDRIKKPLRRKPGTPRGGGEWEEISWEDAFDLVASEMKRIKDEYGNEALWYHYGSGSTGGNITKRGTWPRLINSYGGYLGQYGDYSTAQITAAYPYHYGAWTNTNSFEDAQNSKLLVLFGNNPLETRMSGGGELGVIQKMKKEYGTRIVVIDPRYSDTALNVADQWIPIRPMTDAALVAAICYVIVENDLHDQEYLDKYTVGFDEDHMPEGVPANMSYRAYLDGTGYDKIAKTPEWAAPITGIPANIIRQLAMEIGTTKPCAINQGWGLQRHANGEAGAKAIMTLANVIGQVGISGGGTGGREASYNFPVKAFPLFDGETPPVTTQISCFNWPEAIEDGPSMTDVKDGVRGKEKLDVGIKLMVVNASNTLINQHNDVQNTMKILSDDSKCEFIVVIDHQWTISCDWGDLVLPSTTNFEESDLIPGGSSGEMGYAFAGQKCLEPLHEAKTGYEMCTEIAKRLGIENEFTQGRTQDEWVDWLYEETQAQVPGFPSREELEEKGVWRQKNPDGFMIPLKEFREDPEANPLPTESGKVEIFSKQLYEYSQDWVFEGERANDFVSPIAEYQVTWEGPEDARKNEKYDLQMIGHHYKGRTHSSYANLPKNLEAHPQMLWMNPRDAEKRGLKNGDEVIVYNDRGEVKTELRVTPRIMPGVTSLPQGAWTDIQKDGIDHGGNVNTLTKYHPSPLAKGNPGHTALVNVKKA